jgi:hypothetical protein
MTLRETLVAVVLLAAMLASPPRAIAHCDTLDGPVVRDARAALEARDVTPVLKWVEAEKEPEVREAFRHALAVRALGPEARTLADRFFFETLVRVHREGEGEPYTGLKPAGTAHASESVEKGRAYVAAYVAFVHYAERLLQSATTDAGHAGHDEAAAPVVPEGHRH